MHVRQINALLVSQGREAAIAAATAAGLGWAAKKIHMGEWDTTRFKKGSDAPKPHFVHTVVDNHDGKELVKVATVDGHLEQYVLRWEVTGETSDGKAETRRVCTEPLGRIMIAEARMRLGKTVETAPCPGYGKKTGGGKGSTARKPMKMAA